MGGRRKLGGIQQETVPLDHTMNYRKLQPETSRVSAKKGLYNSLALLATTRYDSSLLVVPRSSDVGVDGVVGGVAGEPLCHHPLVEGPDSPVRVIATDAQDDCTLPGTAPENIGQREACHAHVGGDRLETMAMVEHERFEDGLT